MGQTRVQDTQNQFQSSQYARIYSKRTPWVAPGDGKQKIPMTASPGSHSCGQSFCGRHVSTLCLRVVFKEDVIIWSWHLSQEALTATITACSSFLWKVTGSNITCEKQRSNQQCSRVAFAFLWGGDISLFSISWTCHFTLFQMQALPFPVSWQ